MADKTQKQSDNVPGKWYVDSECVPCNLCLEEAPDLIGFADDDDDGHAFFKKQPESEEDNKMALSAMEICPSEAIGNDG